MILLNLGCGHDRLPEPFVNVDTLKRQFPLGTPERRQLDDEPNYVEADLRDGIPFPERTVDGVLASHLLEHLDAQDAYKLVAECRRVLKPGGLFCASVPDTSYFRKVYPEDTHADSGRLFGEQMDAGNPYTRFFDCALFFEQHLQLLTEDSLWALIVKGGFDPDKIYNASWRSESPAYQRLKGALNRPVFSLVMWAIKGVK